MERGAIKFVSQIWQKPETLSQAKTVARMGAVAIAIDAAFNAVRYVLTKPSKAEVMEQMQIIRGPVTLEQAGVDQIMFERMAGIAQWVGAGITILTIVVMIALAIWQWKKPGWVIPLVFLIYILSGVAMVLTSLTNDLVRETLLVWSNLAGWALNLVLAAVMLAAYRGGRIYQQLKDPIS